MLLFRGALTADSGAIADIDQVAELSLDKQIFQGYRFRKTFKAGAGA